MADPRKDIRSSKLLSGAKNLQEQWNRLKQELNGSTDAFAKYPQFATGARAYIVVSGKPYAVAQRVNYRTQMGYEESRTVDTNFAWEIIPGQVTIHAQLQGLIDPNQPAESESLWSTMSSIVHQPNVTLEVFDKLGERMFYAVGMFVGMTNSIGMGVVGERGLEFVGYIFAHNVEQAFRPYDPTNEVANKLGAIAEGLKSRLGGLL